MSLDAFLNKFDPTPEPAAFGAPGALDKFVAKFGGDTKSYWFYDNTIELRFDVDAHVYYKVGPLGELVAQDGVTTVLKVIDKSHALVPWAAKKTVEKVLRLMPRVIKQEPVVIDPAAKDFIDAGSPTYPVEYVAEMTLDAFEKLLTDAKSAHRDILDDAGDVGHMAHTWLEYYVQACIAGDEQSKETKLLNMPNDERAANCCLAALSWMHGHNVRWLYTERKIYSRKYGYAGTLDGICLVDSCDDKACCPKPFKDRLTVSDWKSSNGLRLTYRYQTASYEQAIEEELGLDITDRWILRLGKEDGEFEPWHLTQEDFHDDLAGFLDALNLCRSIKLTEEAMKGQKAERKEIVKELKEAAKLEEKARKKAERDAAAATRKAEREDKRVAAKAAKKAERMAMSRDYVESRDLGEVVAELKEQIAELKDEAQQARYGDDGIVCGPSQEQVEALLGERPGQYQFTPDVQALVDVAREAEEAEQKKAQIVHVTTAVSTRAAYRDLVPDTYAYSLPVEVVTGSR